MQQTAKTMIMANSINSDWTALAETVWLVSCLYCFIVNLHIIKSFQCGVFFLQSC